MQKRKEYAERVKAQLDRWNRDVDALEAEISKATEDTQDEIRRELDAARAKRDQLLGNLSRLKDVTEDAWDETTTEIDLAWKGIRGALERAARRVRSQHTRG